ncbi:MAG: putative 2-aminoethylphosphonate ABC transporter ATP-binding protein [Proteobacteria bacterium]|nr:MAG: putative 2-aminoethylphosphonate ABC transporter ATP-binding protein [Pseudomonadota bacterium]
MPGLSSTPDRRIENVTKKCGDFEALKDISLEVIESEFVCFLGPSGCGKTTLLRAIAGLDIQTTGRIEQAGVDISALPPSERDFGIVFQSYALFPNLTVDRNVGFGLENRSMPKARIRERVDELLHLVGLPDQGKKYPAQLSGGQQQRVALARALATSPGLLLLDEPLSALDARVRAHLRIEIKELQRRLKVTTIMVTHDQEEALTMADRIVVMDHGVIEQVGSPREIYGSPSSTFVADFIGTMNFLHAIVKSEGEVDVRGRRFHCDTSGLAPETPVTLSIRPEDVSLETGGDDDRNIVETTVRYVEFLGSFCRVGLRSPVFEDGEVCADLSSNMMRERQIDYDAKLSVRLPENLIRVYPA